MEITVTEFISFLILPVIIREFLDCIICQMLIIISQLVKSKDISRCSNISFFIPITFYNSIGASDHHISTYIEFSAMVKKRFVDVMLNNECSVFSFGSWTDFFIYHSCDIIKV